MSLVIEGGSSGDLQFNDHADDAVTVDLKLLPEVKFTFLMRISRRSTHVHAPAVDGSYD
jgi:mitochondrial fission protein ELM1